MTAITNSSSIPLILQHAYQGARNGAGVGALVGTSIVSVTLASGVFQGLLEKGNRAIGNEPKWPLFEGDCQLEQFRDVSICTDQPLFDSFTSLTVYVIGVTTIGGMLFGAVSGAARSVFTKAHSEQI